MASQVAAQQARHGLPGYVVSRWPQPARDDYEVNTLECIADGGGDVGFRIADHALAPHVDAEAVQLFG